MDRVHILSKVLIVLKSNPVTGARTMYHDQVGFNLGPQWWFSLAESTAITHYLRSLKLKTV